MTARTTRQELETQTQRLLESLHHEVEPGISSDRIIALGQHHFQRLLAHATISDYIPLLVYRATKQDLRSSAPPEPSAPPSHEPAVEQPIPEAA
jgi:hypothetical protein